MLRSELVDILNKAPDLPIKAVITDADTSAWLDRTHLEDAVHLGWELFGEVVVERPENAEQYTQVLVLVVRRA